MEKIFLCPLWENAPESEKEKILISKLEGLVPVIIYVDDQAEDLEIFQYNIKKFGFECFVTTNAEEAVNFIQKNRSRVFMVLADYKMPVVDGFELREMVMKISSTIPFSILSGYIDRDLALKGVEKKISSFLQKPLKPVEILSLLKKDGEERLASLFEDYELLKGFTDDASNLVEAVEELCLDLENNPRNSEAISRIFGMIHTIKGSSGFFDPRNLHNFSHAFEELLKELQAGTRQVTEGVISTILKGNDVLKILINEFKTGIHKVHDIPELTKMFKTINEDPQSSPHEAHEISVDEAAGHKDKGQKTSELRVSMAHMNEFMQTSGEMTVIRNMINKTVKSLEKQYQGDKDISHLGELLDEMHKINSDVQSKIVDIRRVSVSSLVKPLSRTVRDTAKALQKEVSFVVEGEELRLDNSIAEVLSKSLVHIVRNSIDHGIEKPAKRIENKKEAKGTLHIKFLLQGENVIIEIHDDGAGINTNIIRQKVIEKGLKSPADAQKMTVDQLQEMIFDPGFSTAEKVTDFSGRGVGMSMVKDSIESLRGSIKIESRLGFETKFRLEIPIPKSVMIMNCLFVGVKDRCYGISQDNILKVVDKTQLQKSECLSLEGAQVIRFNDHLIPVCSLGSLMTVDHSDEDEQMIVIVKSDESIFALSVEKVLDIEDAVIKYLSFNTLKSIGIYLGGTFLGDGSVGLVLSINGIAQKLGITSKTNHLSKNMADLSDKSKHADIEKNNVIVFDLDHKGEYCLLETDILRIEKIKVDLLQQSGSVLMLPYRGQVMTIIDLNHLLFSGPGHSSEEFENSLLKNPEGVLSTIIVNFQDRYIGIVIKDIIDLKTALGPIKMHMKTQYGLKGNYIIDDNVVGLVDLEQILQFNRQDSHQALKVNARSAA